MCADVSFNKITKIADISTLTNLVELNLSNNRISTFVNCGLEKLSLLVRRTFSSPRAMA